MTFLSGSCGFAEKGGREGRNNTASVREQQTGTLETKQCIENLLLFKRNYFIGLGSIISKQL
jgi:hypothetical protein